MRRALWMTALVMGVGLVPRSADAFCGFYVSGADADLYNNATVVVLMRDGTTTVLSMRNAYEGPPENFAMVVPVPTVIQEEDVHTLPANVFQRVDDLAAPRLVEYWEQDPCRPQMYPQALRSMATGGAPMMDLEESAEEDDLGVTIEAEFEVGEYQIVILSARDSGGLDTWLRRENYRIPPGAEPVLRPYVESGTKFFVARVDVEKVSFQDGRAMLSPLRVQYESEQFNLPIRLGLINSEGTQDLLVHILARGQRYEAANYDNVTIPTNLLVQDGVRQSFGAFYNALFDRLLEAHPNSVVTEYSWNANGCDPCPTPALNPNELATLGLDAIGGDPYSFVLTRLHFRYEAEQVSDDLVFRETGALVGGRGMPNRDGQLEREPQVGGQNAFQGRYVILHPWEGEVACENPMRGQWGGPLDGGGEPRPIPATNLAFATRGQSLGSFLAEDLDELGVSAAGAGNVEAQIGDGSGAGGTGPETLPPSAGGCAGCAVDDGAGSGAAFTLAVLLLGLWLRRRRG